MKINFATIGTNWITEEFITTAKNFDDFFLKAVYSRTPAASAFARRYGAELFLTDFQALCKTPGIDAVYIASPNACHAKQAISLMENGKNVLCEKPIASNRKELQNMIDAAKQNNVLLMEAVKSTFTPNFMEIKKNIYKLGPIRSIYANYSKYSSRYDAHKQGKNVNTFKAEFSNGALMDLGIYCLYPIIFLFGTPKSVKSLSTKIPDGVDGAGTTILSYEGFTATINYSKVSNSFLPTEIQGEKATMLIDRVDVPGKFSIYYTDKQKHKEEYYLIQREDSMYYEIENFLACLQNGQKQSEINSLGLSLQVMSVMDQAREQGNICYPADRVETT